MKARRSYQEHDYCQKHGNARNGEASEKTVLLWDANRRFAVDGEWRQVSVTEGGPNIDAPVKVVEKTVLFATLRRVAGIKLVRTQGDHIRLDTARADCDTAKEPE